MSCGKVINFVNPNTWHNKALLLLVQSQSIQNPFLKKIANVGSNILLVGTGATAIVKEGAQFILSVPTSLSITYVALPIIRCVKKDLFKSADEYLPTCRSTCVTLGRTCLKALGVISSLGTILGEVFFVENVSRKNIRFQAWVFGNAQTTKKVSTSSRQLERDTERSHEKMKGEPIIDEELQRKAIEKKRGKEAQAAEIARTKRELQEKEALRKQQEELERGRLEGLEIPMPEEFEVVEADFVAEVAGESIAQAEEEAKDFEGPLENDEHLEKESNSAGSVILGEKENAELTEDRSKPDQLAMNRTGSKKAETSSSNNKGWWEFFVGDGKGSDDSPTIFSFPN